MVHVFLAYTGPSVTISKRYDDLKEREKLRENPSEVRLTSEEKLCTEIIYIVSQTSVRLF